MFSAVIENLLKCIYSMLQIYYILRREEISNKLVAAIWLLHDRIIRFEEFEWQILFEESTYIDFNITKELLRFQLVLQPLHSQDQSPSNSHLFPKTQAVSCREEIQERRGSYWRSIVVCWWPWCWRLLKNRFYFILNLTFHQFLRVLSDLSWNSKSDILDYILLGLIRR